MKPIRSKQLYQYLADKGLLGADPQTLAIAKAEYRRLYKKGWADSRKGLTKEIRIQLTQKQHKAICDKTILQQTNPTTLARTLLLAYAENRATLPDKDDLQSAMQSLTVAISFTQGLLPQPILNMLVEAERKFAEYLSAH